MGMKRITSFFLIFIMVLSLCPVAFAAGHETIVSYEGEGVEEYLLTVPASLAPGGSGEVKLEGTWASDRIINVTADESVILTNDIDSSTKTLAIDFEGISQAGDNTNRVTKIEDISVAAIENALFGTWSGEFYYNLDIEDNENTWFAVTQFSGSNPKLTTLYKDSDGAYIAGCKTPDKYCTSDYPGYSNSVPFYVVITAPNIESGGVWTSSNSEVATINSTTAITGAIAAYCNPKSLGETTISYTIDSEMYSFDLKVYYAGYVSYRNRTVSTVLSADGKTVTIPPIVTKDGLNFLMVSVWKANINGDLTVPFKGWSIDTIIMADTIWSMTGHTIGNFKGDIYWQGTEEAWNHISWGDSGAGKPNNATIHYNYQS